MWGHVMVYSDDTFSTRKLVNVSYSFMEDVEEMQTTLNPRGAVKRNVLVSHYITSVEPLSLIT